MPKGLACGKEDRERYMVVTEIRTERIDALVREQGRGAVRRDPPCLSLVRGGVRAERLESGKPKAESRRLPPGLETRNPKSTTPSSPSHAPTLLPSHLHGAARRAP